MIVNQTSVAGVTNGTLAQPATVALASTVSPEANACLIIPANTGFKDAIGNNIAGSGSLALTAAAFSNTNVDALDALPFGLENVPVSDGSNYSFVLGAALDLNIALGATSVKSFSRPLTAEVTIDLQTFNPTANRTIADGDLIEIWSNSGSTWSKEGETPVFTNNGLLKARINVNHLSTWMAAYGKKTCSKTVSDQLRIRCGRQDRPLPGCLRTGNKPDN